MATKARLETVLTGDDTPFVQAIQRAEQRAQTFAGRVHAALGSAFKRTPDLRAERALSGFTANLASGDIQGALLGVTERLSGLGLAAGVGVGAAVAIFAKAQEQFDAMAKSVDKLKLDLARPLSLQAALGTEGINKEIETTTKDLGDLFEKRKGVFPSLREGAGLFEGLHDVSRGGLQAMKSGVLAPAKDLTPELTATFSAMKRLRDLSTARANAELRIADIGRINLEVSERQATFAKIAEEHDARRAKIILDRGLTKPGRQSVDFFKSLAAEEQTTRTAKKTTKQQFDLQENKEKGDTKTFNQLLDQKEDEAKVEGKILELKKQGLTSEEATTAETRLRIDLLRSELGGTSSLSGRQSIQNKITALKQSLPPDLRPPIGISGEQSLGIHDPMTGEWRHELRPQEQANLRAGQMEADARLRGDQLKYGNDLSAWQERSGNYMRGWDQYSKEDLIKPTPPSGYDIDVGTGKVTPRESAPRSGEVAKPMTKEEFDSIMNKYFGG